MTNLILQEQPLRERRILLGVSGSIAAYKAADLCSRMGKLGADVHVVLTASAARFVGAATFRALTRNPVVSDVFEEPTARRIAHIDLAQSADLVLVAPASADLLARMAHGLADDMLTTCLLATPAATPLLVAPAMNTVMWEHLATRANMGILQSRGVQIIAPGEGLLACQDVGTGKLADVDTLVQAVQSALSRSVSNPASEVSDALAGRRVLITAGATREPLDPVRFLSNRSSGKMGYALAQEAARQGAHVTLVSGFATAPVPDGISLVQVETAQDMLAACQTYFGETDVFIAAAAVADYAPEAAAPHKIKKTEAAGTAGDNIVTLRLKRTPDILASMARQKRPDQIVVGFAAETQDLLAHARAKLDAKRLDMIVANNVTAEGAGFETDTNIVTLLWPDGRAQHLPIASKPAIARDVLNAILRIQREHAE